MSFENQGQSDTTSKFDASQWSTHSWSLHDQPVTVLHCEPFRLKWFATKLVTYVFLINQTPINMAAVDADYAAMRKFASAHKRTWLPIALQCGYAILPIYIGQSFTDPLIDEVQRRFKKRWCVFHIPSLLESETGKVHTLQHKSFWGCIYRDFVLETVEQVSEAVHTGCLLLE